MTLETRFHGDGSQIVLERVQDVEPIIDRNKELQTMEQKSDWGRHIASVPNIFLEKWLNEEWARGNVSLQFGSDEFWQMVGRKLQDPEWKFLRVDAPSTQLGFGS